MRDTAGELANGFHFLGLTQRFLRRQKFGFGCSLRGDISASAINEMVFLNADARDPPIAAILASIAVGKTKCRLTDERQLKAGARVFHVVRVQQLKDRHTGHFGFRPSENCLPCGIGGLKISLGVKCPQQVRAQQPSQPPCLGAFGAAKAGRPKLAELVEAYLERLAILDWTNEVTGHYAKIRSELERSGKPIGNMGLLIASHAASERTILVTNNLKHFSSVPGLTVEVWS